MALPANPLASCLPAVPSSAGVDLGTEVRAGTQLATSGIANNAIGSAQLATNIIQLATFSLTSANILAMYTTPVTVLAGVTGKTIVVHRALLRTTITTTHYLSGGVITLAYGTTGNAATGSIAAAVIAAAANAEGVMAGLSVVSGEALPIQITNATGAFTTGTGTAVVYLWYSLI